MKTLLTTVAALVLVAGCSGTQPPPPCLAAHGSFAVAYTNKDPTKTPTGACALTNSIVGVQKYNQKDAAAMPMLALRPIEVGWNDSSEGSIAIGSFSAAKPDENSFCHVDTFANESVYDRVATETGAGKLTFKFSNVNLYVNAHAPGTQMSFDVDVSDTDPAAPCTASYTAKAVWPVVTCAYESGGVAMDDANCAAVDGWWSYLALNPDFDVKCVADPNDWAGQWNSNPAKGIFEHVGAFCVPRNDIPSFCPAGGCSWRTE